MLVSIPFLTGRKTTAILAVPFLFFFTALGATLHSNEQRADWTHLVSPKATLRVRLAESPQPRGKSIRVKANVLSVAESTGNTSGERKCCGGITLYLRPDSISSTLRYGDQLLLRGYPDTAYRSVYVTSDHYLLSRRDSISLRAKSEALRLRLLFRMQHGPLPPRYAGVAQALTLGWRADIDTETYTHYRDAGISHLLAVSGLHVGLLALLVKFLFFWCGRERRGRIICGSAQVLTVWCFSLLTGLAPSTCRAAIMFSLFIISDIFARNTPKFNLLAATALVTLFSRTSLLFDVGWQLSYCAVTGILLARPVINAYRNRLWQTAMVSLAATTATLPVTLSTFHRFYPYFLIANITIVPIAGMILFISLFYLIIPCQLTSWPLEQTLRITEAVTGWVSSLPGAVVEL